jgi:hypothetical protein
MIIYSTISFLLIAFSVIGIKGHIKERRYKQRQLNIARAYDQLVQRFKLAIDYSEFLRNRYIGIDRRNRKLILIDHCGNKNKEQCIPLYRIGESKIIHIKDELQNTKTILLQLRYKHTDNLIWFCFYNKDYDQLVELPSLSKKALHWKTKIDIHKRRGNISREAEYVL